MKVQIISERVSVEVFDKRDGLVPFQYLQNFEITLSALLKEAG